MKRTFVVTFLALLSAVLSIPASATNVVNFIGLSANSVGMGGTGVSNFTTATEALYKNSALLAFAPIDAGHFTFDLTGGVIQQPETGTYSTTTANTLSGASFTGDVAVAYKVTDYLAVSLGFLPYGGASSDYTGQNNIYQPKNSLTLMRAMAGIAVRPTPWLTLGVAPFLGWNQFALNESVAGFILQTNAQTTRSASSATDFGAQFGVAVRPMENMTIGVTYLTRTSFLYKGLIAIDNFGPNANPANTPNDFTLDQPDEIAAGISYSPIPELTIAFDYRNIGWSRAEGYQEFGFSTQNVVSIGGEYKMEEWRFRAGFNYAATPLANVTGENGATTINLQGHQVFAQSISLLDVFAFPGITTSSITAGVGYSFGHLVDVNVAGIISPSATLTRSGTGAQGAYNYSTSVSQWAVVASASASF